MNITIIGWYGTETIGDRAILAGIISFFNQSFNEFTINLGSLYPFFTTRTLDEDYSLYKHITKKDIKINIFNSRSSKELDNAINNCNILIMGGGPLMHINTMYMVEYAFKKAKTLFKKTMLMGCGIGPLYKPRHQKSLLNIVKYSDFIILRDTCSMNLLTELQSKFKKKESKSNIFISIDPSVQCLLDFENSIFKKDLSEKYIAINLRKFPAEYAQKNISNTINNNLTEIVKTIAATYPETAIQLIPMHYFHIGNDDRDFLNNIRFNLNFKNLFVQNKPLTLTETLNVFRSAIYCVGMRFHAVVFQTLINGKNFILDYTEPEKGKINGFLKDFDANNFYEKKYLNLQINSKTFNFIFDINNNSTKFEPEYKFIKDKLNIYPSLLKQIV